MGLVDNILRNNVQKDVIDMGTPTSSYVKSSSGTTQITIDEDTALKIGALYQGINIIGDTIASMPVYLYKDNEGFTEVFMNDPRSRVMSDVANETLSAFNLKKALIKDLILRGNAYAKIERNGKDVFLRYLPTNVVNTACEFNT